MTRQGRLFKKVQAHLCVAGVPRSVQRKGTKWYTTAELVLGLAVREAYRLEFIGAPLVFLHEYYGLKLH